MINTISIFLPIILVLQSCVFSDCKRVELTHDEKEWFNAYRTDDTLLFRSNLGKIDTLVVKSMSDSYTACNKFELGDYQYNEAGMVLQSSNSHGLGSGHSKIFMNFTKSLQYDTLEPCDKYFKVFDLFSERIGAMDSIPSDTLQISGLSNHLVTYLFKPGVYASDGDSGDQKIVSFNWSKEYGLVRYTIFTGEVYDFWKKI